MLNLAVNNIQRVQNLQRCESLRRLDLSVNFIDRPGLLSLRRWVLPPQVGAVGVLCAHRGGRGVGLRLAGASRWRVEALPAGAPRAAPACTPVPSPLPRARAPPAPPHPRRSLQENEQLEELHLLGNPCTRWPGYRAYVIGTLPRLRRLDGEPVGAAAGGRIPAALHCRQWLGACTQGAAQSSEAGGQ